MATNTAPTNGTQAQNSGQGPLIYTDSLYTDSASSTCSYHKSFDFSNINVDSSYYKQFHQTRIYIKDFEGMTTNGTQVGGKGSTYILSGNLPNTFRYQIGSEWGNPLSDLFKSYNLLMQFGSAAAMQIGGTAEDIGKNFRSGINRAANFMIWNGAKPLGISLTIPVLDDNSYQAECGSVKTNLKEALEFLGCLSLPKLEENGLGFYTPAPSPLQVNIKTSENNKFEMAPNKARIMVQIGGMLFIDNCILKSVSVSYPNTKGLMLRNDGTLTPILAEVTIDISTIETLTSETYTKMLWMKEQEKQGKGEVDLPGIYKAASDATKKGKEELGELWDKFTGNNGMRSSTETISGTTSGKETPELRKVLDSISD